MAIKYSDIEKAKRDGVNSLADDLEEEIDGEITRHAMQDGEFDPFFPFLFLHRNVPLSVIEELKLRYAAAGWTLLWSAMGPELRPMED